MQGVPLAFTSCRLLVLLASSLLLLVSGVLATGNVTLESVTIFQTHEWLGKPTVYFMCQGEKKVYLPDVVEKKYQYEFIGQESWQPLTSLEGSKCKRCGLYEEDKFKHDDTFDEWELCPIHFSLEHKGRYNYFKENEFNITFLCPLCHPSDSTPADQPDNTDANEEREPSNKLSALMVMLVVFVLVVVMALVYAGYRWWQRKKREEQQARFIKLFEDDDDLEAELGLRD